MFYSPPTTPGTLLVSSVSLRAALVCRCVREKEKKNCVLPIHTLLPYFLTLNIKHTNYTLTKHALQTNHYKSSSKIHYCLVRGRISGRILGLRQRKSGFKWNAKTENANRSQNVAKIAFFCFYTFCFIRALFRFSLLVFSLLVVSLRNRL